MLKQDVYVKRLLLENPKFTKGGVPITIENNGWGVTTYSGRSNNGRNSYYAPCDYPQLFGWDKEPTLSTKVDLIMEHLGLEFEYVPSHLTIIKKTPPNDPSGQKESDE